MTRLSWINGLAGIFFFFFTHCSRWEHGAFIPPCCSVGYEHGRGGKGLFYLFKPGIKVITAGSMFLYKRDHGNTRDLVVWSHTWKQKKSKWGISRGLNGKKAGSLFTGGYCLNEYWFKGLTYFLLPQLFHLFYSVWMIVGFISMPTLYSEH